MRQLISRFVLEKYLAGEIKGTLRAASVFVDLSGFSAITDALAKHGDHGAEVLAEVMRALFEPLVQSVYGQGGFVLGYAGDSFTAVFPEQEHASSTARQALASAITMQEHVHASPIIHTELGSFPIHIKAGLGYGDVDWVILGDTAGARATYCMSGPAVDGAVEAEERAAPGKIILHQSIYSLLKDGIKSSTSAENIVFESTIFDLPAPSSSTAMALDPDGLLAFFPAHLSQQTSGGEFREVVSVFVDIPVAPTEEAFVAPFMQGVFALQKRYGGFFLRPDMGDKGFTLLIIWGAPLAHENDIDRALNFLLELKQTTRLDFRAGVTYRVAYTGFIGASLREDYTAYGMGVNLASRMMELAGPGEIWLDEEVFDRASRHFEITSRGSYFFKGIVDQISVFLLHGRAHHTELLYPGILAGRKQELARLGEFLQPLRQGSFAGLMYIKGEAGIGKSRLLAALQKVEIGQDFPLEWIVCPADEILRQPFNPFRDWLARRFELVEEGSREANLQAFETAFAALLGAVPDADLASELTRTQSMLAALLNLEQPGSLYEQLDSKGRYDNTLIALSALLRAIASRKPAVLVIEDLHWLDHDSCAFLEYFMRLLKVEQQRQYPLAILITARPEAELLPLGDISQVSELELGPLSLDELSDLADGRLQSRASPSLVRLVQQRSEGNPFFAEQILRYLHEHGLLHQQTNGLLEALPGSAGSLPTDVRAVLIARLDGLPREVREVVQTASVLGREFETRLLAAMLSHDTQLTEKIHQAEQVNVWFALNELEYIFRHALLRDAAYGMQLVTRQRQLHSLAVRAIEELHSDDLSTHLGELAYHAERANLGAPAIDYLRRAAQAAAAAYLNLQAIDYLTRALSRVPASQLADRFDLLEQRVELFARTGDRLHQLEDIDALEHLAEQLSDQSRLTRAVSLRASYHYVLDEYPQAIQSAERAISLARSSGEVEASLVSYNIWSISLLRQARLRTAMKVARDGLELARLHQKRYHEGLALNSMGMIAQQEEDTDAAQSYLEQARSVAEEIGDLTLSAKVITNQGNLAGYLRQDYYSARRYYEQAYAIIQERGDRYGQAILSGNLAWVAGIQGDFDSAGRFYSQAIKTSREIGNLYSEAYSLMYLSAVASIQGDRALAIDSARQAYELTCKTGDRTGESWSLLNMGHAWLMAEEFEQARQAYDRCIRLRRELDQPGFELEPMAGLIQVALQVDDMEAAARWTEHILADLAGGGVLKRTEEPLRIYFACYEALTKMKDPRAQPLLEEAVRLLDAQVQKLPDQPAREMFVNSVPWRRAIHQARSALR